MSQTSQRQKSHRHVSDLIDLSQHVEIDLAGLRHVCDFLSKAGFEKDRRQSACYVVINDVSY